MPEAETQAFCKIFTMDMYSSVCLCVDMSILHKKVNQCFPVNKKHRTIS